MSQHVVEAIFKATGIGDFIGSIEQAKSSMDGLKKSGEDMKKMGQDMSRFGKEMSLKVTAPIVAMGTYAAKSAIDFESAFAGVRKTVDATEEEFAVLERQIRDMALEVPASAEEIAGVAEAAGQLGVAKEDIISFSETMVQMGVSTNMVSDEAATSMAKFASVMEMPLSEVQRLGSSIVALGNNYATTESDIMALSLRLTGVGNQVGMTEADVMALSAAMSHVGINAEAGGTAMSTVIKRITNAVADGGPLLDEFAKQAGMSASEFATLWRNEPIEALDKFIVGLSKSGEEGKNLNTILSDLNISGIRETDTLLRLAGSSDVLTGAIKLSSDAWEENTALSEEAGERYATTESQLKLLYNNIKELAMTIGEVLLPVINDIVQAIIPFVQALTKWFGGLDERLQKTILIFAGVVAAIGPLLMFFGLLVQGLGALKIAFAVLSGPIGWIIIAIGLLTAGIIYLWNTNEAFRDGVINAWESIVSFYKQASEWLLETIMSLVTGFLEMRERIIETIYNFLVELGQWIVGVVQAFLDMRRRVIDVLYNMLASVGQWFADLGSRFSQGVSDVLSIVTSFVGSFYQAGANIIGNLWSGIKSGFGAIKTGFSDMLGGLRNQLPFSPPKDKSSPLVGLERNGIMEQIAKGIYAGESDIEQALRAVLQNTNEQLDDFSIDRQLSIATENASINGQVTHDIVNDGSGRSMYATFILGGQEFRAFVRNITEQQDSETNLELAY